MNVFSGLLIGASLMVAGSAHAEQLRKTISVVWEEQPRPEGMVINKEATSGVYQLTFIRSVMTSGEQMDQLFVHNTKTDMFCSSSGSSQNTFVDLTCGTTQGYVRLIRGLNALEVEWVWTVQPAPPPAPARAHVRS